jgi:CBS domain-containing protein
LIKIKTGPCSPLYISKKEITMRAHQIMTRNAVTVLPETPIIEVAHKMLENHVSGLPVLDASGKLVGIVSESDFLRRSEIGTQQKRPRWLQYFLSPTHSANDFIHERGRNVEDVMTRDAIVADEDTSLDELVHLMEKNGIKRLPVLRTEQARPPDLAAGGARRRHSLRRVRQSLRCFLPWLNLARERPQPATRRG